MQLVNKCFWNLFKLVLVLAITWHIYLLINVNAHNYGWEPRYVPIEVISILLYGFALRALLKTTPGGYLYTYIWLSFAIGWQLWVSYMMMAPWRLIGWSLGIVFILLLYINKDRFQVSIKYKFILFSLLCLLMVEILFYAITLTLQMTMAETSQWEITQVAESTPEAQDFSNRIVWRGNDEIVGQFSPQPNSNSSLLYNIYHSYTNEVVTSDKYKTYLGILNISTKKVFTIGTGDAPTITSDGQWLGYYYNGYYRYNLQTGQHDKLYDGLVKDKFGIMAPSGDKLVIQKVESKAGYLLDTYPPKWPVYVWLGATYSDKHVWAPDSKTILVLKPNDPLNYFSDLRNLAFYFPDGSLVKQIPIDNDIVKIRDIKLNPEGNKIYAVTMRVNSTLNSIDYYDLEKPELGWQQMNIEGVMHWDVGPRGLIVFNSFPWDESQYDYLLGGKLLHRGLWIIKPGLKEPERISTGPDYNPVFSPDGKKIAFIRGNKARIGDLMILKTQR